MNKFKLCLILGLICLLTVSVSATSFNKPRRQSKPLHAVTDPDLQSVCTSADRKQLNKCAASSRTQGCLCYNNGTCIDTMVDRCKDCSNNDIFSVAPGQRCPKTQAYLCQPPIPGVKYTCMQQSFQSCVCSLNGTCFERNASHCIDCQNPNILAVFENKTCPSQFLQTPPNKFFIPNKCDKGSAKSVSCLKTQTPGCVCYSSNNTCEYRTDSNKCLLCFNKDVVSFNQGEFCPSTKAKIHVCDTNSTDDCKSTAMKSSCVCRANGLCKEMKTNHCKACKSNDVISVIEGDRCPFAKYAGLQKPKQTA